MRWVHRWEEGRLYEASGEVRLHVDGYLKMLVSPLATAAAAHLVELVTFFRRGKESFPSRSAEEPLFLIGLSYTVRFSLSSYSLSALPSSSLPSLSISPSPQFTNFDEKRHL